MYLGIKLRISCQNHSLVFIYARILFLVSLLFVALYRHQPIMLIFSPIMLCCSAQNFDLLCSILCSCKRIVLRWRSSGPPTQLAELLYLGKYCCNEPLIYRHSIKPLNVLISNSNCSAIQTGCCFYETFAIDAQCNVSEVCKPKTIS